MFRRHYLISIIILTGLGAQLYWSLPAFFGILYLLWFGHLADKKNFFGGLAKLSLWLIISGSIFYYLHNLGPLAIYLSCIVSSWVIMRSEKNYDFKSIFDLIKFRWSGNINFASSIIFMILTLTGLYILFTSGTTESIRSLWTTLSFKFLWLYAGLTIVLLWLAGQQKNNNFKLLAGGLFVFMNFATATIIYKLGYSFDGFIHQATETAIAQSGLITPKTPYYIGQYSLVVILNYLTAIKISLLDTWLLPIAISIFLPLTLKKIYPQNFLWPLLGLLLLPTNVLINTTPYGLALLAAVILVLLSNKLTKRNLALGALATTLIHPLVGLPVIIFVIFKIAQFKNLPKFLVAVIALGSMIAVPIAFAVGAKFWPIMSNSWTLDNLNWSFITAHILPVWPNLYAAQNIFISLANLWQTTWWLALIFLTALGYKKQSWPYLLAGLAVWSNALILKIFINNQAVISYERFAFADRLLIIGWFLVSPLIIAGLIKIFDYFQNQKRLTKLLAGLLLTLLLCLSFYNRYPHHDFFNIGRFYSLSTYDQQAVAKIDRQATGHYAVLANQMISASAVKQFGFTRSYTWEQDREQYFYPLPTSSPLYQYYLKMISGPDRKIIDEVFDKISVDKIYFVVNYYWHNSASIIEQSQKIADDYFNIDDKIWVFVFNR